MLTVPYYRGWFDLYVYYGTLDDWLRHGGHIYDYLLPGTPYGFTYPPFAALCMLPMALVPRGAAVGVAFALTGAAACLVSPVTWVHHLVWLLPALVLARSVVAYLVLCSSVVWLWRFDASGVSGFLGSNAYMWLTLWLLISTRHVLRPVGWAHARRRHTHRTGLP
jgi:uncharacterized membrane protein